MSDFRQRIKTHLLETGAWDRDTRVTINGLNKRNMASRLNFKKNKAQYFLNPFIPGPIRHGSLEMYTAITGLIYKLIKNKKSKNIKSAADFKREVDKISGPWDKYKSTMYDFLDSLEDVMYENKGKNYIQFILNPLIHGPLSEKYIHKLKEDVKETLLKEGGKDVPLNKQLTPELRKKLLQDIHERKIMRDLGK